MKKPEKLTRGEELLAQALEECLDEDLSFVPPEREIARTHRFSERFAESMDRFLGKEKYTYQNMLKDSRFLAPNIHKAP